MAIDLIVLRNQAHICGLIREHAAELAAVFVEPITLSPHAYLKQLAPKEYLQALQRTCTETGVCLIFDEVMTEMGRPQDLGAVAARPECQSNAYAVRLTPARTN